ncbi:MAG: hypothetical protein ACOCYE_02020 [Pseudomonadota bacterium]
MAENLDDQIRENASGPSEYAVDDQTVRQHSLRDQIEADRYLASKAAAKSKKLGIRRHRAKPPGGCGC